MVTPQRTPPAMARVRLVLPQNAENAAHLSAVTQHTAQHTVFNASCVTQDMGSEDEDEDEEDAAARRR